VTEWCLLNKQGQVINMSQKYGVAEPWLSQYQLDMGYVWVPANKVSPNVIRDYRYWSERP